MWFCVIFLPWDFSDRNLDNWLEFLPPPPPPKEQQHNNNKQTYKQRKTNQGRLPGYTNDFIIPLPSQNMQTNASAGQHKGRALGSHLEDKIFKCKLPCGKWGFCKLVIRVQHVRQSCLNYANLLVLCKPVYFLLLHQCLTNLKSNDKTQWTHREQVHSSLKTRKHDSQWLLQQNTVSSVY